MMEEAVRGRCRELLTESHCTLELITGGNAKHNIALDQPSCLLMSWRSHSGAAARSNLLWIRDKLAER